MKYVVGDNKVAVGAGLMAIFVRNAMLHTSATFKSPAVWPTLLQWYRFPGFMAMIVLAYIKAMEVAERDINSVGLGEIIGPFVKTWQERFKFHGDDSSNDVIDIMIQRMASFIHLPTWIFQHCINDEAGEQVLADGAPASSLPAATVHHTINAFKQYNNLAKKKEAKQNASSAAATSKKSVKSNTKQNNKQTNKQTNKATKQANSQTLTHTR